MTETYRVPLERVYRHVSESHLPLRRSDRGRPLLDEVVLPRRVRGGNILRAEVVQPYKHEYEQHLAASPDGTDVLLEFWARPRYSARQILHLKSKQYFPLAEVAGLYRHHYFPSNLRRLNHAFAYDIQGLSSREIRATLPKWPLSPYTPEGLWTFVPPTSGDDWSIRAERRVQTERPLPDLVAILMKRAQFHGVTNGGPKLIVTYDP
ncbi:MAG TPA: hypothetical protein VGN17_04935 [Bryobacteraceae bacterium]|jgi:hypothetical protein